MSSTTKMALFWGVVVLLIAPCLAKEEGDAEFAFNLFSDLAPILALFGEKFATQFASESLDWLDHLIFAMVPLGIVTAMTAAIRVQGPSVAQAFIGRARENVASAEIELMSSTSNEVCELFNGKGIVRAMGKAGIKQILVFPSLYKEEKDKLQQDDKPAPFLTVLKGTRSPACGIHTIATACGNYPISALGAPIVKDPRLPWGAEVMGGREYRGYFHSGITRASQRIRYPPINVYFRRALQALTLRPKPKADDEEWGFSMTWSMLGKHGRELGKHREIDELSYKLRERGSHEGSDGETEQMKALRRLGPPNLQLNHSRPHTEDDEEKQKLLVLAIAVIGVIVQLGLVAIAGLVTYHEPTKTSVGYDEKTYGFPCFAAGSFALCFGMGVCSYIIGRSTVEWSWEPLRRLGSDELDPFLFWIQKAQDVNDQTFGPYAIPAGTRRRIITSSRHNTHELSGSNPWGVVTILGVLAAIAGFILQFIGLRALPYPVSFAQLGAILFMALLRALMRNKTRRPLHGFDALARYELDYLASRIVVEEEFLPPDMRTFALSGKRAWLAEKEQRHHWRVLTASDKSDGKFYFRGITTQAITQPEAQSETDKKTLETEDKGTRPSSSDGRVSSQQLVRVRQRLGYITTWQSTASSAALALSRSMVYVLSELVKDPRRLRTEGKESSGFRQDATLCMNITLPTTSCTGIRPRGPDSPSSQDAEEDFVTIRCFWRAGDGVNAVDGGKWVVDPDSLDAILSLWMAYVDETHKPGLRKSTPDVDGEASQQPGWYDPGATTPTYRYWRILGDDFLVNGRLKRDLLWWVDGFCEEILAPIRDPDVKLVIGFNGPQALGSYSPPPPDDTAELAVESCLPLAQILAQHIFTVFMWSIAQHLPPTCLGQGLPAHQQEVEVAQARKFLPQHFLETWSEPKLRHHRLSKIAQQIEQTGLGDTTDILLCMVPALSFADLLPNEAMLGILPRKNPDLGWAEMADCYYHLLRSNWNIPVEERFCYEVVVASIDFLLAASEPYYDDGVEPGPELREALNRLGEVLMDKYLPILTKLLFIYHLQGRFEDVVRALHQAVTSQNIRESFKQKPGSTVLSELLDRLEGDCPDSGWTDSWGVASSTHRFARKLSFSDGHLVMLRILAGDDYYKAREGEPTVNRRLLDAYDTISMCTNDYDIFGWTPMHYTSLCMEFTTVQKIYGAVYDLDRSSGKRSILKLRDKCGRNPLHVAAQGGRHENLKELLSFAEDSKMVVQSAGFDRMTPLHLAVKAGSGKCFDALRAALRGAPATQTDIWDREALHIAASRGLSTLCTKLLSYRGRTEPEREDAMGHTPLMLILKKLHGVAYDNTATRDELQQVAGKILEKVQQIADFKYENGGTLLHVVAKYGSLEILFDKIEKDLEGLDINGQDDDGRTPLHVAIMANREDNALFMLTKMRGEDGKIDRAKTKTGDGISAAAIACEMGLEKVVKKLLDKDTKLAEKDDEQKRNLLHFTVGTTKATLTVPSQTVPYTRLIDFLLGRAGIEDLNAEAADENGQTPLITACISGFTYAVRQILKRALELTRSTDSEDQPGSDAFAKLVNARDKEYNQSALEYACERGHEEIVRELLDQQQYRVTHEGAAKKWHRYTALHFAISFSREDAAGPSWYNIARLLCDAVPEFLEKKDEYGRTPLVLAEEQGRDDIRQLILSHKNATYQQKKPFLTATLAEPNDRRVAYIPQLLRSLNRGDFQTLCKDGERDRIAQLADRESIAAWTDTCIALDLPDEEEEGGVDIPFHFAIRGYRPDEILGTIEKLKRHWEAHAQHEPGSAAEKLTRSDGHGAGTTGGDPGWNLLDWARSFGVDETTLGMIGKKYDEAVAQLPEAKQHERVRKADVVSADVRCLFNLSTSQRNSGLVDQGPGKATKICITEKISNDLDAMFVSLRSTLPLRPDIKDFSIHVKIIKWPPSGTLMIGFCGEFSPRDDTMDYYPGQFYNTWAFEDQGRLYVEGQWDSVASQRGISSSFEQGDTITVFWKASATSGRAEVFYTKRSKNSKKGIEFRSGDDDGDAVPLLKKERFWKGKIYPCIGLDVSSSGVGLEIELDFATSKILTAGAVSSG